MRSEGSWFHPRLGITAVSQIADFKAHYLTPKNVLRDFSDREKAQLAATLVRASNTRALTCFEVKSSSNRLNGGRLMDSMAIGQHSDRAL